jgi:hypothetical protein
MIACLRVRWGSSVYVQKKSCSLTSNGGVFSFSSSTRNRALPLTLLLLDVVSVEVAADILKLAIVCKSKDMAIERGCRNLSSSCGSTLWIIS